MSARARGACSTPPVASEAVLKAALGPGKTAEVMRPRSPRCVRALARAQLSCAQLARARLASTAHAHTLCAGQLRGRVASRAAGRVLLRRHRPQGRERQAAPSRRQQVPPQPAPPCAAPPPCAGASISARRAGTASSSSPSDRCSHQRRANPSAFPPRAHSCPRVTAFIRPRARAASRPRPPRAHRRAHRPTGPAQVKAFPLLALRTVAADGTVARWIFDGGVGAEVLLFFCPLAYVCPLAHLRPLAPRLR